MSLTKRHAEKMGWFDDQGYHENANWEKDYLDYQAREDDNPAYKDDAPEEIEIITCLACDEDMSEEEHPDDDYRICHYCRTYTKVDGDFNDEEVKQWVITTHNKLKDGKRFNR
tara:strand:+ start:1269 stop:1607 length:339 start_codon:yes stop_codon:yes gene_type:complete